MAHTITIQVSNSNTVWSNETSLPWIVVHKNGMFASMVAVQANYLELLQEMATRLTKKACWGRSSWTIIQESAATLQSRHSQLFPPGMKTQPMPQASREFGNLRQ